MITDLFQFQWKVDQDGYAIETDAAGRDIITPRGWRWRNYRPLELDGLWLQFAETCRMPEGVRRFVDEFGTLRDAQDGVEYNQGVARKLWAIAQLLKDGNCQAAMDTFNDTRADSLAFPRLQANLVWSNGKPEMAIIPDMLEDALRLQALQAIEGNRRYKRCRNEGCSRWFGVGTRAPIGQTYTKRRKFCSDRCRVAHARQQKREAVANGQ